MVELGFADWLTLAQTVGIIGTMLMTLYFSKRQIQGITVDVETRYSMIWMKRGIGSASSSSTTPNGLVS